MSLDHLSNGTSFVMILITGISSIKEDQSGVRTAITFPYSPAIPVLCYTVCNLISELGPPHN